MYTYPFPMVSATATIVLFHNDSILLGRRAESREKSEKVFAGWVSLPGGFLNAGQEEIEDTIIRECFEETSIMLDKSRLNLFHISSNPKTDPRAHVINACYWAELNKNDIETAKAGDDLSELRFVYCGTIIEDGIDLAFDHIEIAKRAIKNYYK